MPTTRVLPHRQSVLGDAAFPPRRWKPPPWMCVLPRHAGSLSPQGGQTPNVKKSWLRREKKTVRVATKSGIQLGMRRSRAFPDFGRLVTVIRVLPGFRLFFCRDLISLSRRAEFLDASLPARRVGKVMQRMQHVFCDSDASMPAPRPNLLDAAPRWLSPPLLRKPSPGVPPASQDGWVGKLGWTGRLGKMSWARIRCDGASRRGRRNMLSSWTRLSAPRCDLLDFWPRLSPLLAATR